MTSHVAPVQIRDATAADATAIAAIYAPYVMGTAITFEAEPPSADTIAARIADAQRLHAHLVGEVDGRVVGYAYGHVYNSRDAYRWACEVSIYLDSDQRRVGHGRALYAALLARLTERGYRRVLAGVTQPNPASMALHRSFGFTDAGYHRRVGWKFGAWHQLDLLPADQEIDPPPEITYSAGDPDVARPELEDAYAAAWEEWDASGEATAWEATSADGLGDAAG